MKLIKIGETTASKKRVQFLCVDASDGMTPEIGEAGGQPEISWNGGAYTSTGIGVLVDLGDGNYYAELTDGVLATTGVTIHPRYKSANTLEAVGTPVQVVAFDPDDAAKLGLTNLDATMSSRGTADPGDAMALIADAVDDTSVEDYSKFMADVSALALEASIIALNDFDPASDTVAHVTLVDTTTTNTDQRGTDGAALAATALSKLVWTNAKAAFLDGAISGVAMAVWDKLTSALTTAGSIGKLIVDYLDAAISDIPAGSGSIILSASSRTITIEGGEAVNGNGDIEITRDDDTDIRFTWSDEDITGCTIYLTVRENMSSTSADDDDAVFQVVADLTTPESGIFTFSIGKDETDAADIDTRYWYDIQSIDEDGKVTTILKKVRLTVSGDVTRRRTTAD